MMPVDGISRHSNGKDQILCICLEHAELVVWFDFHMNPMSLHHVDISLSWTYNNQFLL